jgi:excalibur calcium-binding domain-containing protein
MGAALLLAASGEAGRSQPLYASCAALHALYPHGVGLAYAKDRTSGTPVTNFVRNNRLYALVLSYNSALDNDHDGIACEQG